MGIRNPPSYLQNITLVSAGHTAQNDRLTQGALWTPGAIGLAGSTGVAPAAAGSQGEVTVLSNTLIRVNPFRAVIQGTRSALQGQYVVVNDGPVDLAIDAQASGVSRKDTLMVNVCDTAFSPDTLDTARLIVVKGTAAASNPNGPTLGGANLANYMILGTINVPATGGTVTFTPADSSLRPGGAAVAVGGIEPVSATDGIPGVYDGQYRDDPAGPDAGLQRWNAALNRWNPVTGGYVGVQPANVAVAPGSGYGFENARFSAAYAGQRFTCIAQTWVQILTGGQQQTVQLQQNIGNIGQNWTLGQSTFDTVDRVGGAPGPEWRLITRVFDIYAIAAGVVIINLGLYTGTGGTNTQVINPRCWVFDSPLFT